MQPFISTDYSNSPMDPERIRILQDAERAYINGVPDEDGNIEWPTYRGLADQHLIPVRVINEQAAKHRWNARRERRKGQLVYFKQQQQMRQWQDMDREFTVHAAEAFHKLSFVHQRAIHEAYEEAVRAWGADADAAAKGSRELHKMNVKLNELHTLTKSIKDLSEAQAVRANRAQGLPLGYEDVQLPAELPTAVEEQAQLEARGSADLPPVDVLEIFKVMNEMQKRVIDRLDNNDIIVGELDNDEPE